MRAPPSRRKAPVTTDWLEANLQNPEIRLIEVSVNPGVYARGHIPRATNNWFAARGAWALDVYGVENVKLPDGDRRLGDAEGRALATQPLPLAAGNMPTPALRAHLGDVVQASQTDCDRHHPRVR